MYDYGNLVYLDLQKTGSRFVVKFLEQTCNLPFRSGIEHTFVRRDYNPKSLYFITIRHPVQQYSSLYRYGLGEKIGFVYQNLVSIGKGDLYEKKDWNYNRWLEFVLDPDNASCLGEGYDELPKSVELGFMSFRYLCYATLHPFKLLKLFESNSDPVGLTLKTSIIDHTIKMEQLNKGLLDFATVVRPGFFDQNKVLNFFKDSKPINNSEVKHEEIEKVSEENLKKIKKKEHLLLQFY